MMIKSAVFSECQKYRYSLWRTWNSKKPYALFVCLNPSTADANYDDPTVRRCVRFAGSWGGYGGLCMANLFAFRATKPAVMKKAKDPVGNLNDTYLLDLHLKSGITVCAWGVHGEYKDRCWQVLRILDRDVYCLGLTKGGHPKHPLYLKKTLRPIKWEV